MSDEKQAFFVEATDGRKFKMVIRGDLGKLSVAKIRRYLKSYGVPDNQLLLHRGQMLSDDMLGDDFGLQNQGLLHLGDPHDADDNDDAPQHTHTAAVPSAAGRRNTATAPPGVVEGAHPSGLRPSSSERNNIVHSPPASAGKTPQKWNMAPQQAWRDPHDVSQQDMQEELDELRAEMLRVLAEKDALKKQLEKAKSSPNNNNINNNVPSSKQKQQTDPLQNAKENVQSLADSLQLSLQLDTNLTCVIGTDEEFSILVTFDPATERLYTYATVLTSLPDNEQVRHKLYEVLLEGSLLGRETCGGGIGISLENQIVVLSTSLPMGSVDAQALRRMMPGFVESLKRWRTLVNELVY